MIICDYLSTKLSDLFADNDDFSDGDSFPSIIKPSQEWHSAIASTLTILNQIIKKENNHHSLKKGVILSSPIFSLNDHQLLSNFETILFTPYLKSSTALLPYHQELSVVNNHSNLWPTHLSFNEKDILNKEPFFLVFTEEFSCLIVKQNNTFREDKILFSFSPEITAKAWTLLELRLRETERIKLNYCRELITNLIGINPHYKIVTKFTSEMLKNLKQQVSVKENPSEKEPHTYQSISLKKTPLPPYPELELLQALSHEIRTPLTTIKTTTQLLKRKAKSYSELTKYLEMIEQECTAQINRMELIFKAVEIESKSEKKERVKLVPISLENILNQAIPSWEKQAQRRNINLEVILPHKLPQIITDPNILSNILTGLIEKFTRNLPSGCHFKLIILPVGNQLKLQFLSKSYCPENNQTKSLGKLLLFQPETGNLFLSHDVTKNIFHALGGRFTMKQKPHGGEILTIFLPLGQHR